MAGAAEGCECAAPGKLTRVVARDLVARGFTVSGPEGGEAGRLRVACLPDAECEVSVSDHGCVVWYWWPADYRPADAVMVTRLVLSALGCSGTKPEDQLARPAPELPLRSVAGRKLKGAGLDVHLEVHGDQEFFGVCAEIVVTSPDDPGRGKVRVDDYGGTIPVQSRWRARASPS